MESFNTTDSNESGDVVREYHTRVLSDPFLVPSARPPMQAQQSSSTLSYPVPAQAPKLAQQAHAKEAMSRQGGLEDGHSHYHNHQPIDAPPAKQPTQRASSYEFNLTSGNFTYPGRSSTETSTTQSSQLPPQQPYSPDPALNPHANTSSFQPHPQQPPATPTTLTQWQTLCAFETHLAHCPRVQHHDPSARHIGPCPIPAVTRADFVAHHLRRLDRQQLAYGSAIDGFRRAGGDAARVADHERALREANRVLDALCAAARVTRKDVRFGVGARFFHRLPVFWRDIRR